MKKKALLAFALMGVGLATLSSCGKDKTKEDPTVQKELTDADKVLNNYIFAQEDTEVTSLTLPAVQKFNDVEYPLTWTSDNAAIAIAETAAEGKYTTTITRPETEIQTVTLTVTLKYSDTLSATKSFKVRVAPITVYDISNNFKFEYDKKTVFTGFTLPTSASFGGKTATITWKSKSDKLTVSGTNATFSPQNTRVAAKLEATFEYGGRTAKCNYDVTLYKERTNEELFNAFYDECGKYSEAFTLKGYVLAKAGYTTSYGNGYVYILDQTKLGSYYTYRSYVDDQATWDSLQVGTRVQIEDCVAKNYNGLYETQGNKTQHLSVITDDSVLAPLTEDEITALKAGKNVDAALTAAKTSDEYKALIKQTGNIVELKNWTVKSVNTSATAGAGATLLTLEKDGVEITLQTNKYVMDLSSTADSASDKVTKLAKTFKAGDVVTLTGVLYYSSGWTVCAYDGTTITKSNTYTAAVKKITDLGIKKAVIKQSTINLPTLDGYTFTVSAGDATSVTCTETGVTFNPTDTLEDVKLVFTITETATGAQVKKIYNVSVGKATDAQQVAFEKAENTFDVKKSGTYTLNTTPSVYEGVVITYEVTAGSDVASITEVSGKTKLSIKYLDAATTVKVKATYTLNEATATQEYTINVPATVYESTSSIVTNKNAGDDIAVTGTVKSINATKNYCWITDGTQDFEIYGKVDSSSTINYSDLAVGDTITVVGKYKIYKKVADDSSTWVHETDSYPVITSKTAASA